MRQNNYTPIIASLFLIATSLFLNAQGIIVHKTDGTKIEIPYSEFDSITTFYTIIPDTIVSDTVSPANPETGENNIASSQEVDLGLSVNWAGWNLGASSPEERGNFYAWGEITTKSQFDTSTYLYYSSSSLNIGSNISATKYDAPYNNWGGDWRMPTSDEFNELISCTWEEITFNGTTGYKVTGPNGNSIFLPNTGHKQGSQNTTSSNGYYWTSKGMTTMSYAYCLSTANGFEGIVLKERYWGLAIRPVKTKY